MRFPLPLAFLTTFASASTISSQKAFQDHNTRLYNDLFTTYHKEMSPYNGHGLSNDSYPLTPLTIALQYARLIRVLPLIYYFLTNWQDPRLRWDPSKYGGIDHIYVNRFNVWMPEFYPCESSQASLVSTEQSLSIGLNASGFMDTFVIYSTFYSCEFDVFRFPFDKQRCYYCFIMFNYDSKSELRFNAKYASRPYIYDTSEWSLKLHEIHYEASIDSEFNMGLLYYNISLTRRPQFWIGLVITPTFLIGSLIIIGLFFGRGEDIVNNAVGLGLTTMMSMMVIVGILADSFAKSQNIPILGWYLIAEIIIITLAVLALMSSEVLCRFCSTVVTAACRESAESRYSTKTRNCLNSVKNFLREFLLERGKHSNVWLFALFILAHSVNLIVLFCL